MSVKPGLAWQTSPHRAELLALYDQADALVDGWSCGGCSEGFAGGAGSAGPNRSGSAGSPPCCHFGIVGREPYPTAVELEEIGYAMATRGIRASGHAVDARRRLPVADGGRCPLLSVEGRCGIYASRPLGCRTFFCDAAEAPYGARAKLPRADLRAIGGRIAALSARFAPRDHRPRPLTRALVCGHRKVSP